MVNRHFARITVLIALTAVLATAERAFAGPIIFFATQREVDAGQQFLFNNQPGFWSASLTAEPASNWGYGTASQDSLIATNFFGGTGSTAARLDGAQVAGARSGVGVSFQIDEPYVADLVMDLSVTGTGFAGFGLVNSTANPFQSIWFENITAGDASFVRQIILQPGQYGFNFGAGNNLYGAANAPGSASFDGGLTLTPLAPPPPSPVPEPGTMLLMGSGLLFAVRKMRSS